MAMQNESRFFPYENRERVSERPHLPTYSCSFMLHHNDKTLVNIE